jgi:single-strand DNA-binding protein
MSDLRMPDLNQVLIAGRLTRDPELKHTGSGRAYCRFSVANTRYYRTKDGEKGEETVFVNCSCWDRQAEFIGERLQKGRPVLVEGRLRSYEFEDRDSGQKRNRIEVNARRVTPLDWDDSGGSGGGGGGGGGSRSSGASQEPEEPAPEDDIPF